MKHTSRKTVLIIFLAALFVAAIYFMSKTYVSYRNYQLVQSSDIYIDLVHQLNKTVTTLENERMISALYLGTKGDVGFQSVAARRQESDNAIARLETYITKQPKLSSLQNKFNNLHEDLRYIRSRIDVINDDYKNILFTYYQDKIITPLLHENKKWLTQLAQSIHSVSYYFTTYSELIHYRDTLNQEQSFIAYILARKEKMSMPDLLQWEKILNEEQTPHLQRLTGKPIYPLLQKHLHENELTSSVTVLRRAVLKGINSGNYIIDTTTWLQQMQRDIDAVTETETTLFDYLKSLDFKAIIPITLYINFAILILTIVLLFFLLRLYKKPLSVTEQRITDKNPDIQIKHTNNEQSHRKDVTDTPHSKSFAEDFVTKQIINDTADLPLTNIEPDEEETFASDEEESLNEASAEHKTDEATIPESTFAPIQLMKELIKPYIPIAQQNNISFHYAIDPSLPDICIGNPEKILEMMNLFLDTAMETGNARKEVTFRVENVAQKKFETVLSFTIRDSGKYISPEEQKKIKKGSSKTHHSLTEAFSFYNKNLVHAGQIVKQLGGRLQISSDHKEGTEFTVSLNLKKFISTEQQL